LAVTTLCVVVSNDAAVAPEIDNNVEKCCKDGQVFKDLFNKTF